MNHYAELIITPEDLNKHTIIQKNITIERSNKVLLSGTIYHEKYSPLAGAVVNIFEQYGDSKRKIIGYVITNQNGEFAVMVTKSNHIDYYLEVYEPLTNY